MSFRAARASMLSTLLCLAAAPPLHAQFGGMMDAARKRAAEAAHKADSIAAAKMGKPDVAGKVERKDRSGAGADSSSTVGRVGGGNAGRLWLNSDFKAGPDVLFSHDYTVDQVGNFPERLVFGEGNMEVAQTDSGGRVLRLSSSTGRFTVIPKTKLPEQFTLEFDFMPMPGHPQEIRFTDEPESSRPMHGVVTIECYEPTVCDGGIRTAQAWTKAVAPDAHTHDMIHVRVMADGMYAKVYMNDTRVANVPNADLGRSQHIVFALAGDEKNATLVGPITVGGGSKTIYDALEKNGHVGTLGIRFESGSDRIKPESGATLKEIAAMLKEHSQLALTIEGNTDDVGDPAENQSLSERRAAAVKEALVNEFSVDGSRLKTLGRGSSKPAKPGKTDEIRAMNRRVELVKP